MNCAERDHYLPPSRRPPDQRSTVEAEGASDRWNLRMNCVGQQPG
jgi:hypothetical protein